MTAESKRHLILRDADASDSASLLEWRNDSTSLEMSVTRAEVLSADHARWFAARLASPHCRMYVAISTDGQRIGVVRFDSDALDRAEISINISPAFRGKGFGCLSLALSVEKYLSDNATIREITATIRDNNVSSERIFSKTGFGNRRAAETTGFFVLTYARYTSP